MGKPVRREIWVVHQKDLSERHGETTHLVELSKALRTLGHVVRLIGPKVGRVPASIDAVQLQCIGDPRWIRLLTYEVALWLYFIRSWSVLRRRKPALYVRKGALLLAPFAVGRLLGLRVVVEVNDVSWTDIPGRRVSSLLKGLLCLVAGIEYRMADRIVAVTDAVKEDVVDTYRVSADKVVVIHNGANTELFRPLDTVQCRLRLGLPIERHLVTFVGNIVPWQGLQVAIDAVALLPRGSTVLIVVGDGVQRQELERYAGERGVRDCVRFIGSVPFEEVPYYIGAADVCIAPFADMERNRKGLSALKVFEYMACGKPVVTTEAMAHVVDGAGKVFPAGDSVALASVLVDLLEHPQERQWMGALARQRCASEFSWTSVAEKVVTLLQ